MESGGQDGEDHCGSQHGHSIHETDGNRPLNHPDAVVIPRDSRGSPGRLPALLRSGGRLLGHPGDEVLLTGAGQLGHRVPLTPDGGEVD